MVQENQWPKIGVNCLNLILSDTALGKTPIQWATVLL